MEYYSAVNRNEIGSFVEMWMDLEAVIKSEVSQKVKNTEVEKPFDHFMIKNSTN